MKKLALTAITLAALVSGCGNLKDELRDRLGERAQLLRESSIEGSLAALDANDVAQLEDDAEAYFEDDQTNTGGQSAPQTSPGFRAEAIALAPGQPNPDFDNVQVTPYECGLATCLPHYVTGSREIKNRRGQSIGSLDVSAEFDFYSTLALAVAGAEGDKNLAVPARTYYARVAFTTTRTLSGPDGKSDTLTTTGYRVFSLIPGEWYIVDTKHDTTGFPTRPDGKPSITSVSFTRVFAAPVSTDTTGSSHRIIAFSDDTTISTDRYFDYDAATGVLTGSWLHQGRFGFEGVGEFNVNTNKTLCRLDDVGTVTIDRTFGEAVTRVTSEHVEIAHDKTVTQIDGTLTLADGSTRTKSLTRTQVKPTDCSDETAVREFTLEGTTYRGAEISVDVKRSPGSLQIHGDRTMPNGNQLTVDAVRSEGVLNVDGELKNAAGDTIATVHIVVHQDGSGHGEITRRVDGEELKRSFEIENGRVFLKENGKREEVRAE